MYTLRTNWYQKLNAHQQETCLIAEVGCGRQVLPTVRKASSGH